MTRTTKAALQAQLDEANAAYEAAHASLMDVSAQRDALQAQLEATQFLLHKRSAQAAAPRMERPALPNWQAERLAAMAQAKELAMRFGRSVKVAA